MATETSGAGPAVVTQPTDVGLKRELGLIGATWASETSIIGSGWLFGALFAAQAVGGAAVLAWVIAGVVVIVLALCHAELGAMYPVSGGTARFPHFAFGSVAGISFGFFSYVQAVTIAPIECFAFMQYAAYFWPGIYDSTTKNVTGAGFALTIVLMAIFVAVNFLAMRIFARVNNVITWWKVAVPVLAIIVLLFKFHPGNFTAGVGFMPGGIKALFGALPAAGIIFAYSGFEQCDQLAGEIKNPGRNLPRAIIISILIGTAIYVLLQVAFIGAMPPSELGKGFAGITNTSILDGPFAGLAGLVGLGLLAWILRIDAFVSPTGTGLIYTTGTSRISYGLARNRYYPQIFGKVSSNGEIVVPECVRVALRPLIDQIDALDETIGAIDRELEASVKTDETARRLMTIPGVGPVTASAITATIQDMSAFASGREFSAFLGLTPRQSSTGGKERLGRITKMGDRYLRKLLVVGACATLSHRKGHNDALRRWASGMLERKTVKYKFKLTAVALANKVARIVFVLMTRGGQYDGRPVAA